MPPDADHDAIGALIEGQFTALAWVEGADADWPGFEAGFLPGGTLYPAARPVRAQTVAAFASRMRSLARDGVLRTFTERPLGVRVPRFGNVAVALAGCEMLENGTGVSRDVSAFLLLKEHGRWRIAAQAWDAEAGDAAMPAWLRAGGGSPHPDRAER